MPENSKTKYLSKKTPNMMWKTLLKEIKRHGENFFYFNKKRIQILTKYFFT